MSSGQIATFWEIIKKKLNINYFRVLHSVYSFFVCINVHRTLAPKHVVDAQHMFVLIKSVHLVGMINGVR